MGSVEFWMSEIACYITSIDADSAMVDIVLNYDAEKQEFTTEQPVILNGSLTELVSLQTFTNVVITKFNEVAATPADPKITELEFGEWSHYIYCDIPAVGTEGETLNPQKLFYVVWIDKGGEIAPYTFKADMYYNFDEDTTEVPYDINYSSWSNDHSIYFYEDDVTVYESWSKVGIQSIYYGGGEVRKSNIGWENTPFLTGISEINAENAGNAVIYNPAGQRVVAPSNGLYIVNGKKVMIK